MASLTHVCMWSNNGWKRITAEQAARMHPGGTVSAHSALFMCELCGQYVTLTDGDIRIRYFKHSAYEKSKNCPERTFGPGYSISYNAQEHPLPIRIVCSSSTSFHFELGLIRVPPSYLNKDFRIEIKPTEVHNISYIFNRERLNDNHITYLPIGERPFKQYVLNFYNGQDKLHEFWPTKVNGIDPAGTLFDKDSGQELLYDADVELDKEYYLLKCGFVYEKSSESIQIQLLMQKRFGLELWSLYVVSASSFSEQAARFFLDFHCRLTEHPVALHPVWPLFVEGNYIIKHSQNTLYMLVEGNVTAVKAFPTSEIHPLNHSSTQSKLYKVTCSDRQQLISAGRTSILQYTYLWKEPLTQLGTLPEISVTDISGNEVNPGVTSALPPQKFLRFKSYYDGELVISRNNHVIDRRKLPATNYVDLSELSYNSCIQVVVGLDIVWQIDFKLSRPDTATNDFEALKRITNVTGSTIAAPHSLRNILVGMSNYPSICRWIRQCIQNDSINEQSYRKLQAMYRNLHINEQGDL